MSFWEDFFATEKIIYAALGAFLAGAMGFIIALLSDIALDQVTLVLFMSVGFILGNYVKIKKLEKMREEAEKLKQKNKKVINEKSTSKPKK